MPDPNSDIGVSQNLNLNQESPPVMLPVYRQYASQLDYMRRRWTHENASKKAPLTRFWGKWSSICNGVIKQFSNEAGDTQQFEAERGFFKAVWSDEFFPGQAPYRRYIMQLRYIEEKANACGIPKATFNQMCNAFAECRRKDLEPDYDVKQYKTEYSLWNHFWPDQPFPGADPSPYPKIGHFPQVMEKNVPAVNRGLPTKNGLPGQNGFVALDSPVQDTLHNAPQLHQFSTHPKRQAQSLPPENPVSSQFLSASASGSNQKTLGVKFPTTASNMAQELHNVHNKAEASQLKLQREPLGDTTNKMISAPVDFETGSPEEGEIFERPRMAKSMPPTGQEGRELASAKAPVQKDRGAATISTDMLHDDQISDPLDNTFNGKLSVPVSSQSEALKEPDIIQNADMPENTKPEEVTGELTGVLARSNPPATPLSNFQKPTIASESKTGSASVQFDTTMCDSAFDIMFLVKPGSKTVIIDNALTKKENLSNIQLEAFNEGSRFAKVDSFMAAVGKDFTLMAALCKVLCCNIYSEKLTTSGKGPHSLGVSVRVEPWPVTKGMTFKTEFLDKAIWLIDRWGALRIEEVWDEIVNAVALKFMNNSNDVAEQPVEEILESEQGRVAKRRRINEMDLPGGEMAS